MSDGIQDLIDKKEREIKSLHIKNIMKPFGVTSEKAVEALEIPQDQRALYAGLVRKGQ